MPIIAHEAKRSYIHINYEYYKKEKEKLIDFNYARNECRADMHTTCQRKVYRRDHDDDDVNFLL